jgi:hypothetical protein
MINPDHDSSLRKRANSAGKMREMHSNLDENIGDQQNIETVFRTGCHWKNSETSDT